MPAPASPIGLAWGPRGHLFVAGEASPAIARYRLERGALRRDATLELAGVRAIRDLAAGPEGALHVVEEHDGRLITLEPAAEPDAAGVLAARRTDAFVGLGPIEVERIGDRVLVAALLDHALVIRRVDARGRPAPEGEARIRHDGPIWSFDAVATPRGLLVAAGGVEDHPLDRTGGSFGYIDSFVYLYLVPPRGEPSRLAAVNVSDLRVVTPKAVALAATGDTTTVTVTGYGGDRVLELSWRGDLAAAPRFDASPIPPGIAALVALPGGALVAADPLLDAWISKRPAQAPVITPVPDEGAPPRSAESRVGEALFFTTLMAPYNRTEGPLSRFTCETCHFEGHVDGRTHHTGRGHVRATTKPLVGLFNNRPHFSRALDPDLTTVAHAEFAVAGARSGADPWFQLEVADAPWLAALAPGETVYDPDELRRALMVFLMGFTHRPNPSAIGRSTFTADERAGAAVFAELCEGCHQARLVSDDPASRRAAGDWERLVLSREGPIVWATDERKRTGVEPYVHDDGARVPSLRRLFRKRPYLTNGSARDLGGVLERVRVGEGTFLHHDAGARPGLRALDERERAVLAAFLDLL